MKKFLQIDFWVQLIVLIVTLSYIALNSIENNELNSYIYYFYFIVGISQFISFIIRLFLNYKKSFIFVAYGILVSPIWLILILFYLFKENMNNVLSDNLTTGILSFLIISLFYTPILSLIYIGEIFSTYKFYEKPNL